jgi:hypothetical protein
MEYGEFFFRMEDGDVVEGCVVDLHSWLNSKIQDTRTKEAPKFRIQIISKSYLVASIYLFVL